IEFSKDKDYAFQPAPEMIWVSLRSTANAAEDPRPVPGVLFHPLYHYPAPAWGLEVRGWPKGHKPILDVWWTEEGNRLPAAAVLTRGIDFQQLINLAQKTVPGTGTSSTQPTQVTVESVQVEKRKV